MAYGFANMPSLVVSTSSTVTSNAIELFEDSVALAIQAPASLTNTSFTVQGALSTASGATFATVQSGGVDITLAAGKMLVITRTPFRQLQLVGTSTEAATRTFTVAKVFET